MTPPKTKAVGVSKVRKGVFPSPKTGLSSNPTAPQAKDWEKQGWKQVIYYIAKKAKWKRGRDIEMFKLLDFVVSRVDDLLHSNREEVIREIIGWLKLWRPIFYKTTVTDDDIKELDELQGEQKGGD